ncbi:MAG TPA: hypothetical protein VNO14_18660 [Blastocatellia bacterium]|nr:hypothetical protein [Blastocatellia bacterium]
MRRLLYTLSAAAVSIFILTVGAARPVHGEAAIASSLGEDHISNATRRELARARRATARYHDIEKALEDGYVDINVFIPQMGYHYLRPSILDGTFDIEKPELLVYALTPNSRCLRLVAVEYAVPLDQSPTAPEGFTGEADVWHANEEFGLWTLHVWIWFPNPEGVFAELNPRVR